MWQAAEGTASQAKQRKKWWLIVGIGLLMGALVALGVAYMSARNDLMNQATKGEYEASQLTKKIGSYLLLPEETPELAVVKDVDKLRSQEFFKNAENDDKVLIFPKSGRALLYRPSIDKVVEYAKVNLNPATN